MSYVAPLFIIYIYLKDKFFREVIIGPRFTLSFLGFIVVSVLVLLALIIKLTIKSIRAKPSFSKYSFILVITLVGLFIPVYLLLKLYNFTFILEVEAHQFFELMRTSINTLRNIVYIFMGTTSASTIFKFIALGIDREYVLELDWL